MLWGNNQTCSRNTEENIKGTVPIFKDPFTVWTDHHYNIMAVLLYALLLYLDNSLLMFPFVPNFGLPQKTFGIPAFIIALQMTALWLNIEVDMDYLYSFSENKLCVVKLKESLMLVR